MSSYIDRTKKFFCFLLSLTLVLSITTSYIHADEDSEEYTEPYIWEPFVKPIVYPDPFELSYEALPEAIRKGSPLALSAKANREVLFYSLNQLAEQQRNASNSISGLHTAMTGLSQLRSGIDATFNASIAAGQVPSGIEMLLKSAVDAQLSMSQGQLSSQLASISTGDKGYSTIGDLSATIDNIDDASLQIIHGAQMLYHGYWTADRQIKRGEEELVLLKRQQRVVDLLLSLGRTTPQTSKSLAEGISTLEHNLASASIEKASLLTELNLMLGRPADSTLILQPLPSPNMETIMNFDQETVWKKVYSNSYILKGKKHSQAGLQEQYDDVKKNFGEYGDRAWRASQQYEGAKLSTALTAEQLRSRFDKFCEQLDQQITNIALEQKKLITLEATRDRIQIKFNLGYGSENELLTASNNVRKQQAVLDQAKDNLLLNWQRISLAQEGMDLSFGESK